MLIELTEEIYARMKALGMHEGEIAFVLHTSVRKLEIAKQEFNLFNVEGRVDDLQEVSTIVKKRLNRFNDTRGRKIGWRKDMTVNQ